VELARKQNLIIRKCRCAKGARWHYNTEAYANYGVLQSICGSRVIEKKQ
jgi:hypothetical protein